MNTPVTTENKSERIFTRYQVFVIAILAVIQFTVVLDFMVLSPLGAFLLDEMKISTSQFGLVVSAYAFSAGASGLLAAGFADRFDRKKLLLFFYIGFITGTLLCGLAPGYYFLLGARVVTGLFGGVLSSVGFAIITDLFKMEVRGRVMGFVQMAFAASQVLGIPVGLFLANYYGWRAPFWMITCVGVLTAMVIALNLRPVTGHLGTKREVSAFRHLAGTLTRPRYLLAYATTVTLATGGFMLMPFGSTFSVHNLGITMEALPLLYGISGIFTIFFGPLIGRLSDSLGKFRVFWAGSLLTMVMVAIYCNLGVTPFLAVVAINVLMFLGVSSRMISTSALITAIPDMHDRGAFMSINSSVQQVSGGIGSAIAGMIVVQTASGGLQHYDTLGYIVIGAMVVTIIMMYFVNRLVQRSQHETASKIV